MENHSYVSILDRKRFMYPGEDTTSVNVEGIMQRNHKKSGNTTKYLYIMVMVLSIVE